MFDVESHPALTIINVTNDLDLASADALWAAIELAAATRPLPVAVSLADCHFCDSTGLGILVRASRRLDGRFVIIVPATSPCTRVLTITGLIRALPIVPTLERALLSFDPSEPQGPIVREALSSWTSEHRLRPNEP